MNRVSNQVPEIVISGMLEGEKSKPAVQLLARSASTSGLPPAEAMIVSEPVPVPTNDAGTAIAW